MIELTVPSGVLTDAGRTGVLRELAAVLLRWEGAPDSDFFRAQAWSYLHEVPVGAQITAADEAPRFRVDVTVPQGALSERRKAGLVEDVTAIVLKTAGLTEHDNLRVWVLIHEQADGSWGAGGRIVRYADLVKLAEGTAAADA
ncbi:4-oxalocrotonate tautomerase family protein [Kribbella sp. NPDC050124]|uniref:4-oxalocrotonate tautomerase family protein n=1 Tax=Kribbella sp. NPDC050124 TaxID=3364114 RepID=UPI0037AFFF62